MDLPFLPQVSTHARLLNQKDLEVLRKTLRLPTPIHCLFLSQFDTEHAFRQDLRWAPMFLVFNLAGDCLVSPCCRVGWSETFPGESTDGAVSL